MTVRGQGCRLSFLDGSQEALRVRRYVDFDLAQATAARIANIRLWITNEYHHSGLRDDGAAIFDRLLGMSRNSIPLT